MTTLNLPNEKAIDLAVKALLKTATPKEQRLITKAQANLHKGLEILATTDGVLLIPSSTRNGVWHRLTALDGCSCEATVRCWHLHLTSILELAHAHPCAETPDPGGGGDDCPDHGPYGDDECPKCDLYKTLDVQRIIAKVRETLRPTMPNLMRDKALREMNELFN